ncbi:glycoside hydrolase family 2 protein [Flavobacterium sp. ARAG 55.4]|uniref:glycoside hydrolase family 2 protein n=1 Tax=Flavobacterium sp. ARAG 55.4 TaxID=3451357 RepID=UPI003F44A09E
MKSIVLLFLFCVFSINVFSQDNKVSDLTSLKWRLCLDKEATWANDELYLTPEISKLPNNPPTGGWETLQKKGKEITIPSTVEEHFWGENGNSFGITGDYIGVSWFSTQFKANQNWKGKRIFLNFESTRLRAEIYINKQLVGYDIYNGTPYSIEISKYIDYSKNNKLAVRITDPDGNFAWIDFLNDYWGMKQPLSASHGFGGITGGVTITVKDKSYFEDIFIKNTPEITKITIETTLNSSNPKLNGELIAELYETENKVLLSKTISLSNNNKTSFNLDFPKAKLWSIETPNLYFVKLKWKGADGSEDIAIKRFGFRWFDVVDVNGDKQFQLNHKRVMLRTSISWGYWPVNGMIPTKELAKKQIQVAKDLGLNMLNFHRGIGQEMILDLADEMGLLYYAEPGGYKTGINSKFSQDINRERLKRMITLFRSHPSLVIYNMINESTRDPEPFEVDDIQLAHNWDETRTITFTSTNFSKKMKYLNDLNPEKIEAPVKLHMLPYDHTLLYQGWWDMHHADGPGVYLDKFYNSPTDFNRNSNNTSEIVMWGEDGAIGTPPRLELLNNELKGKNLGWDGQAYINQFNAFDAFLTTKGFRKAFSTVDSLTQSLGSVAMYYQGRMIENVRISNTVDCYVVNGWEGEKIENHSGIVDIFRNPKANPKIMAHYNQPLFVAVKARELVLEKGKNATIDLHIVNEKNIQGNHTLEISATDNSGEIYKNSFSVNLIGKDTYGQLLKENINFPVINDGYITINTSLKKGDKTIATGFEKLFITSLKKELPTITISDTTNTLSHLLKGIAIVNNNVTAVKIQDIKTKVLLTDNFNTLFGKQAFPLRQDILRWVSHGNKLVIIDDVENFSNWLSTKEVMDYRGSKKIKTNWYGGNYFVKEDKIFNDLPVNTAFNWEYQCLAGYENNRLGIRSENGETIVGIYADHKEELYSAVVRIPLGRGEIILSSLDLKKAIKSNTSASIVAKKILQNMIIN